MLATSICLIIDPWGLYKAQWSPDKLNSIRVWHDNFIKKRDLSVVSWALFYFLYHSQMAGEYWWCWLSSPDHLQRWRLHRRPSSQHGNFSISTVGYPDGVYHNPNPVNIWLGPSFRRENRTFGLVFRDPSLFSSANAFNALSALPSAFGRNVFMNLSEANNWRQSSGLCSMLSRSSWIVGGSGAQRPPPTYDAPGSKWI